MAKQRYINTHFWDDNYIVTLDPIEKLLFIYFLTNPLTEISGAYEIPLRRIAFDTGIDRDMVLKILARFEEEDRLAYRDGWILIPNFIKHQSNTDTINTGIQKLLNGCPDWICDRVYIEYGYRIGKNPNLNRDRDMNRDENRDTNPASPERTQDGFPKPNWEYPISDLIASFPNIEFTPAQIGHIVADVKDTPLDREAWTATLTLYTRNYDPALRRYLPTRTGTLLNVFKDEKAKIERKNGTNRNDGSNGKRTPGEIIAGREYR